METKTCGTCWAVIATRMADQHDEWHQRIAEVAIESTQRIDALAHRIQEIGAGS